MIQTKINDKLYRLQADEGEVITLKGNRYFTDITDRCVLADDLDKYEEAPKEDILPYTKEQYDEKVRELIRQHYDVDKEFEVLHDTLNAFITPAPMSDTEDTAYTSVLEKYAAYDAYVKECKVKAKELLSNG